MNCPYCGVAVAPGTMYCPRCNTQLMGGYAPQQNDQQTFQPMYQQGYQQGFAPQQSYYQQPVQEMLPGNGMNAYPPQQSMQPMQQPAPQQYYPPQATAQQYGIGQQPKRPGVLETLLKDMSSLFVESFTNPGQALNRLYQNGDVITAPVVVGIVLVEVFLGGMALMRGVVRLLFSLISAIMGMNLAGSGSSLNQAASYIAGKVGPAAGGIAVLCQLLAIAIPVALVLVYVCLLKKKPFSWQLALGMVAVTTMPTLVASLLVMLLSLLSPWLSLLVMIAGVVISCLQLSAMLNAMLGVPGEQLLTAKMVLFPIIIVLTLGLIALVGGWLSGGVLNHMISLLDSVGTMI